MCKGSHGHKNNKMTECIPCAVPPKLGNTVVMLIVRRGSSVEQKTLTPTLEEDRVHRFTGIFGGLCPCNIGGISQACD